MKKLSLLALAFAFSFSTAFAQEQEDPGQESEKKEQKEKTNPYEHFAKRKALGLSLGIPGIGLEYAQNVAKHVNLRARFNYFGLSGYETTLNVSGQDVNVVAGAQALNFDLMAEYLPFTKSSFKLVGGVAYLANMGITADVMLDRSIQYGDITIDPEEIGQIDIGVDWSGFAPYLGFGFGRAVPKRRVGFGVEIGAYYAGAPDVSITATEMLAGTADEEQELEENLAPYAWIPRVTLKLSVKLGKK